jgi:hypothetical protein
MLGSNDGTAVPGAGVHFSSGIEKLTAPESFFTHLAFVRLVCNSQLRRKVTIEIYLVYQCFIPLFTTSQI